MRHSLLWHLAVCLFSLLCGVVLGSSGLCGMTVAASACYECIKGSAIRAVVHRKKAFLPGFFKPVYAAACQTVLRIDTSLDFHVKASNGRRAQAREAIR